MRPEAQEIHYEQNDDRGTKATHPAFGQIAAHRVQGGHRSLYGSDFAHHATMVITISRSELNRDLSRDWHYAREELIEVELSEAQWATFVSAPNVGSGPPCTIRHIGMERVPLLPDPADRGDQFRGEFKETLEDGLDSLKAILARLDEMGLPKGKASEIAQAIKASIRELSANLPFVEKQFGEHVEDTVERAKQEIHGYMQGVIHRAGVKALSERDMPLAIENKPEPESHD